MMETRQDFTLAQARRFQIVLADTCLDHVLECDVCAEQVEVCPELARLLSLKMVWQQRIERLARSEVA